jgi:hypothetical protein
MKSKYTPLHSACLITLAFPALAAAQSTDPVGGWDKPLWEIRHFGGPPQMEVIADCTGDGKQDIVAQHLDNLGPVAILDGQSGELWYQSPHNDSAEVKYSLQDVDGDGVQDLLWREPNFSQPAAPNLGRMRMVQGASKAILWQAVGFAPEEAMGSRANIVDLDGDALPDVLAFTTSKGMTAISGETGTVLWTQSTGVGRWARKTADVNSDGINEVVFSGGGQLTFRDGATGMILWSESASMGNSARSTSMDFFDLNGDGRDDVILRDQFADTSGISDAGGLEAHDGATGQTLWTTYGTSTSSEMGTGVYYYDANADGVTDVLALSRYEQTMIDGATGSVLWSKQLRVSIFSGTTWAQADLNGDSVLDLVIPEFYPTVQITAINGIDGSNLWSFPHLDANARWSRLLIEDVDSNGIDDVITGAPWANTSMGYVAVIDGQNGSAMWEMDGQFPSESIGANLYFSPASPITPGQVLVRSEGANPGISSYLAASGSQQWQTTLPAAPSIISWFAEDLNGDGEKELIDVPISSSFLATILQPSTGALLNQHTVLGSGQTRLEGSIDDSDGDGIRELAFNTQSTTHEPSQIRIYSGLQSSYTSGLNLSADTLSVSSGGQVGIEVSVPWTYRNWRYRLLLSQSGTGPTTLSWIQVPLTDDYLFQRTLAGQYIHGSFFAPTGKIDVNGEAGILIQALPNQIPTSMVGRTIHMAVIVETEFATPVFSSGAEAVTIVM